MHKILTRLGIALAVFATVLGIGIAPATASPDGNYASTNLYFVCGPHFGGHVDVHFNHQHNTPAQEFPYGVFWGRDSGDGGMVRLIAYYADPQYLWGWENIADYTYGLPGVTSGVMTTHATFRASTGRIKYTMYISDGSYCTFGSAGDVLFGQS